MIKLAHITTAYQSVITILDSKLRGLDTFDDLDVTAISSLAQMDAPRSPAVKYIHIEMARSVKPFADLKSIWQLYKVIKREKFDIVHSHTAKAGFITAIAAKIAGVPLICHTYHGLPFFEGQGRKTYYLYRFLEKAACLFRDYVFTQNKRDMPECVKLMGSEDKVYLAGNGVNIELIQKSAAEQVERAAEDYPGEGLRLVLLSRFEPVKRVHDFFVVADKLRRQGIAVSCVVAGMGPLEDKLRREIGEMGLDDCVNLVGFTKHPHGLLASSDVVVLCSEKEGIPRAIMEAMALQKPVVATDVLGTQELVVDGETGFLVPLGDLDAMTEKLGVLAQDPELRASMGGRGKSRVTEHYNETKIVEFLYRFYRTHSKSQ